MASSTSAMPPLEGAAAGCRQGRGNVLIQSTQTRVEDTQQACCILCLLAFMLIHSSIPLALSFLAKALMARWLWVFTLPMEHPITCATSATSMSSQ